MCCTCDKIMSDSHLGHVGEKRCCMYIWWGCTVSLYIGRTWKVTYDVSWRMMFCVKQQVTTNNNCARCQELAVIVIMQYINIMLTIT